MCRGIALGWNKEKGFVTKFNVSSHMKTLENSDNYFCMEIIRNDENENGYVIELDEQSFHNGELDAVVAKKWGKWLTVCGGFKKVFADRVEKWRSKNNVKILKGLLNCQSYATIDGNNDQRHATIGVDNNQRCAKIDVDNDQYRAKIGGDNDQRCATIGCEFYLGGLKLKRYPGATKIIAELEDDLTLVELMEWCAENPGKTKKALKEDE